MKDFFISDIRADEACELITAVSAKEHRATKSGKPYLHLVLSDRSGTIEGRVWEDADYWSNLFKVGDVIEILGRGQIYNGKIQVVINRIQEAKADEFSQADLLPGLDNIDALWDQVWRCTSVIHDDWVRNIVQLVLEKVKDKLMRAPAGIKVHHAYVGGLLEHMASMAQVAWKLCSHYSFLDQDYLLAGCLLHDIGKCYELAVTTTFETTTEGQLLGHIAIGAALVDECASRAPQRTIWHLKHLILSHHGDPEKGALVRPKTPEAIALHCIDMLDAHLNVARHAPGDGEWSDFHYTLQRSFWRQSPSASGGDPPANEPA